jgi:Ran GTPase-activating protein (RanGAP) involved in mRNA processing and transport
LAGNNIYSSGLKSLSAVLSSCTLASLDLGGNLIEGDGMTELVGLNQSSLTSLSLAGSELDCSGLKALAKGLCGSKITMLNLRRTRLRSILFPLSAVLHRCSLHTLDLSFNNLVDEDVRRLVENLANTFISALNLSKNLISSIGAKHIATVLRSSRLTDLDMGENELGDGAVPLFRAVFGSALTCLNLSQNRLTDDYLRPLSTFLKGSSLTSLNLDSNRLELDGLKHISSALVSGSQLSELSLCSNAFGSKGLETLARSLSHLKKLSLNGNNFGDEGAILLANALPSSCLAHLSISSCKVGDDGASALAQALEHSKLVELDLLDAETPLCEDTVLALNLAFKRSEYLAVLNYVGSCSD